MQGIAFILFSKILFFRLKKLQYYLYIAELNNSKIHEINKWQEIEAAKGSNHQAYYSGLSKVEYNSGSYRDSNRTLLLPIWFHSYEANIFLSHFVVFRPICM